MIGAAGRKRSGCRLGLLLAVAVAVALAGGPADAQEKRVLVIGIDGLLAAAVGTEYTPVMNALYEDGRGFLAYGYTEDLTFSGPSWSSILNGVHRDRHGVTTNQYDGHDFSAYPSFLERLKRETPALGTAAFVTWPLLENNFRLPGGEVRGVDRLVSRERKEEGDVRVLAEAIELLERGDPGAIFFYQNDVDAAGHAHGFSMSVPEYREQVRVTDGRLGRLLGAVAARPGVRAGREDWLVMVVTDHGGHGTHHTGNLHVQRLVPMIVSGAGARCAAPHVRPRVVDVTRTVLTHMGVPAARQAELDGHDLLARCREAVPPAALGRNLVLNGSGELDRGFADRSFDQSISGWRDQEHTGLLDGHHSMTLVRDPWAGPAAAAGNLFAGGSKGASSRMTQRVDVSGLRAALSPGGARYRLAGRLGARPGTPDRMVFTAHFLDAAGHVIGTAAIESVPATGAGDASPLREREATGPVPAATAAIVFELHAIGQGEAGVEAYADRLSFQLLPAASHE